MKALLKDLKLKDTWVRIISKSGHSYAGQIKRIFQNYIQLGFVYTSKPKNGMTLVLFAKDIESIEFLDCKNTTAWTNA